MFLNGQSCNPRPLSNPYLLLFCCYKALKDEQLGHVWSQDDGGDFLLTPA